MTTDRNSEGAVAYVHGTPYGTFWTEWFRGMDIADYAERYLYTTPPATIPAAEVQALVERLGLLARDSRRDNLFGRASGLEDAADELAKLIPRNPE